MPRTVLLLHRLPDGSSHYDWMLETAPGGPLLTFRIEARIDHPGLEAFTGQRLGDHRAAYLTYEGPVSGGRGTVERVASGTFRRIDAGSAPEAFSVEVDFGDGPRRWIGRPDPSAGESAEPVWGFELAPLERPGSAR